MKPYNRVAKTLLITLLSLLLTAPAWAQKNTVKGTVADTSENKKLPYAIVALIDLSDSSLYRSIRTNEDGKFELTAITPGKYMLMVSYPRMADYLQSLDINDHSIIDLSTIPMISKADLLQEVIVRAGIPVRMRGDTLEYTADSFAVQPGANVEELLKRLPGITVEKDGRIIAQGQEVKKMLVDGDEFFGDDPGLAAEYLQADAVEKVQVFDKKSEEADFTGIDDGVRTKTINLKLKKNRENGSFGKLSGASDGRQYYHAEAMGALFSGSKKMSVFGLASRTGKQELSFSEMTKYVNPDYEMIDDGSGTIVRRSYDYFEGENYTGNGVPAVESGGAHYSDKWNNDKQKLFSNYRIRQINASGWSNNHSTTVLPDGTGFDNFNERTEKNYQFRQNASGSLALQLDSFSSVKFSVKGSLLRSSNQNSNSGVSNNLKGLMVNNSVHLSNSAGEDKRFGSNISFRHRFRKAGQTFSLTLQQDYNGRLNDSYDSSRNNYYDPGSGLYRSADSLNQLQKSDNRYHSWAAKAQYTDRIGKHWGWSVEYGWKDGLAENIFSTLNKINGKFDYQVDSLSNDYSFRVQSHITGGVISWNGRKVNITAGTKAFFTGLNQMNNDAQTELHRHFVNLARQLSFNWKKSQSMNFTARYNGETFQPSVEQLQPLHRSSNRLYVQIGNPGLQPGLRHTLNLSFNKSNWPLNRYWYSGIYATYEANHITTSTTIDAQNRTVSQYINLDGVPSIYAHSGFGWQNKKRHLKYDVTISAERYGDFVIQNGKKLKNEGLGLNPSFRLSHEWKDVMSTAYDLTLDYRMGWSDIPGYQSQRNFTHRHTLTNTFYLPKKIELGSDCVFSFQPKNSSFNTHFNTIQWNAYIQKKLLKNGQGSIKLSVNDILNNNTGYQRSLYGNTINESNRLVIKRYWLLTATWNFSKSLN